MLGLWVITNIATIAALSFLGPPPKQPPPPPLQEEEYHLDHSTREDQDAAPVVNGAASEDAGTDKDLWPNNSAADTFKQESEIAPDAHTRAALTPGVLYPVHREPSAQAGSVHDEFAVPMPPTESAQGNSLAAQSRSGGDQNSKRDNAASEVAADIRATSLEDAERGGAGSSRSSSGGGNEAAHSDDKALNLPFEPITLTFNDLHYYVPNPAGSGELELLKVHHTLPYCVMPSSPVRSTARL
jgi:hypothetical protein